MGAYHNFAWNDVINQLWVTKKKDNIYEEDEAGILFCFHLIGAVSGNYITMGDSNFNNNSGTITMA